MSSEHDLKEQLQAAGRRILEHPGHQEYLELRALERSLADVFVPNARELDQLLEAATTNEALAIELVQNVREPVVRDRFHGQVSQRLHNYLASSNSLVEHVRRLMRGRSGPIADEFNRRKVEVQTHDEVPFMADLRNYTLHRTLPFFGHTLSITGVNTPDAKMKSEVLLGVAALLESDRWSTRSRSFLEGQGESIALRPLVKEHTKLVFDLNLWLHAQLVKANGPALDEANELVIDANAVVTGGDREAARKHAGWIGEDVETSPGPSGAP